MGPSPTVEALNTQLQYLWRASPFYEDKFRSHGFDPRYRLEREADMARFPFTEKDELRRSLESNPPLGSHVAAPLETIVQIQSTSGTTGTPSFIGLTPSDLSGWCELGKRCLEAAGVVAGDVVCHAWSMSKGFTGGLPVALVISRMALCLIPLGAESGVERILTVMARQHPNVLLGTPSYVGYLGEAAHQVVGLPATELGVRRLVVGAEPGGGIPSVRAHLQDLWGATCCEVLGNSDIAPIIFGECTERAGMHFMGDDFVYVELINPATGEIVEPVEGASGELVYTALLRQASPLFRFRSGDWVEVLSTSCPCGRPSSRIRCVGRTDDMLIVRGVNIWPTAVQEVVSRYRPLLGGGMRIMKDFAGHATAGRLRIRVEVSGSEDDLVAVEKALTEDLKSSLALSAIVEMVPVGTLESPGIGKVKLIEQC